MAFRFPSLGLTVQLVQPLAHLHWEASGCGNRTCPSSGFDPCEAMPSEGGSVASESSSSMGEASPLSLGFLPIAFSSLIRGAWEDKPSHIIFQSSFMDLTVDKKALQFLLL